MTDLHQHQQRSPVSRTPSGLVQLPPIHRDVLIRRGKRTLDPATLDPEATVQQVYTNDHFTEIVSIPLGDVAQLPASGLGVARLVLCKAFHSAERGCSNRLCRRVHARLPTSSQSDMRTEQAEDPASPRPPAVQKVHVNYAWRSLAAVAYPRFGSGMILAVAPPNVDGPLEYLDSASVLKTHALDSTRPRPLRHCAHYRFNRACNLGPECHFIHAVFIDPNAKKHQRAPTPMELHHHHSTCQWETSSSSCESSTNAPCVDSEWMPFREYESSPSEAFATSSDVVTPFVGRYRFDAYSWTQVRRPVLPHRAAAHSCSSSSIGGCSVDANPSPLSCSEGDEEEEHQVTLQESVSTRRGVSSPNTSTINH